MYQSRPDSSSLRRRYPGTQTDCQAIWSSYAKDSRILTAWSSPGPPVRTLAEAVSILIFMNPTSLSAMSSGCRTSSHLPGTEWSGVLASATRQADTNARLGCLLTDMIDDILCENALCLVIVPLNPLVCVAMQDCRLIIQGMGLRCEAEYTPPNMGS